MTDIDVHAKPSRMARKKEFTEQIRLPLAPGETAEIDSVLDKGEKRLDMLRKAIRLEVKRRKRLRKEAE